MECEECYEQIEFDTDGWGRLVCLNRSTLSVHHCTQEKLKGAHDMAYGHQDLVSGGEADHFRSMVEELHTKLGLTPAQVWARSGLKQNATGGPSEGIMRDALRGKPDREVYEAVQSFYKRQMRLSTIKKRSAEAVAAARQGVLDFVQAHPGCFVTDITKARSGVPNAGKKLVRDMISDGLLSIRQERAHTPTGFATRLYIPGAEPVHPPEDNKPAEHVELHIESAKSRIKEAVAASEAVEPAHTIIKMQIKGMPTWSEITEMLKLAQRSIALKSDEVRNNGTLLESDRERLSQSYSAKAALLQDFIQQELT